MGGRGGGHPHPGMGFSLAAGGGGAPGSVPVSMAPAFVPQAHPHFVGSPGVGIILPSPSISPPWSSFDTPGPRDLTFTLGVLAR